MSKKITFPKNFLWGAATSAEQSEGKGHIKKGETIFSHQFKKDPNRFWNKVGPTETSTFALNYKEDIKRLKKFKVNSYRTSLSWARIFPEGDFTKPNQDAITFYHSVIDEFHKNNIELILTLFHFDMPMIYQNKGGWESREVWEDFLSYAKFVFHEFGSKIKIWTTMNEPWVPIQAGYLHKLYLPEVQDEQRAVNAAFGVLMSHAKVVNYFNKNIKKDFPQNIIGAIFNSTIVYPKDENNLEDVKAAKYLDFFQFSGLTDAMILGKINPETVNWLREMQLTPLNLNKNDLKELAKVNVDFIGLNYYAPNRAQKPDTDNYKPKNKFEKYFSPYDLPNKRENKFRGWEIYPEGIFDTFKLLKKRYGKDKKYMLTEFGIGVENEEIFRNKNTGEIDDTYRIVFLKEHLVQLKRVIDELNLDVIGAHIWCWYDSWSWINAYKNRYGIFEIDLKTQKRIPKQSAHFFKQMVENNGFEWNDEKTEDYLDFDNLKFSKSVKI